MIKNVCAALGLLLFSVFLLTASGHTYSPDEESLVYVTQSLVTHGGFDIPDPDKYPVVGGHRGVDGKVYSGTGLAQSALVVPMYIAGEQIARLFDFHFRDFIVRLVVVALFNALLTALSGMILFAWMRRVGFSSRVSLTLVLVWAFATMVWVYARTFFSEPLLTFFFLLTCYGIRAFHDTRAARWMVVAGLAAGLAVLTKLQGVLVLPAAAIYFVALEVRAEEKPVFLEKTGFWRGILGMLVRGLLFVGALAVGLVATGYFNFARFGDVLQSGRGEVSQAFPILQGLYGLLLSSGKSVFLYAPPIILSFFAFPRFFKRHLAEALLCVTFILTFIVFHARLQIWSGDGAWGPRYLVSTLPFWVLPIGAILKDWWRNLLTRGVVIALVLAGIFVNLLGLTINFDAYINLQPNGNARHFTLAASPILAHWDLLRARVADWWGEVVAAQNSVVLVKGFLAGGEELFPRYLASRALILIKSDLNQPLELNLEALDYRPEQKEKRRLVFRANGAELPSALMPRLESGRLQYSVRIPADARWLPVEIDTLGSEPVGTSPMGDELGVHLQSLEIDALPILKDISIPPLPTAIPKAAWAWFYEPAHAQFDFVAWYLFFSGLDDAAVVAIIVVFSLAGILGLIGSAPTIWRAVR